MNVWGRHARAGNRRAALQYLLAALLLPCGIARSGEAPARETPPLPVYAPERDTEAENRPVFGAPKEDSAPRQRLDFSRHNRESAAPGGNARNDGKDARAPAGDTRQNGAGRHAPPTPRNPLWSFLPVLLLVVCLGCWLCIMFLKRWGPGGKSLFSSPAMEILGRIQVDRGKYIALVRVGRRVLITGVNQNGFDQLGEITDPAEAADLMMEARPKNKSGKDVFRNLFFEHIAGNSPAAGATPPPAAPAADVPVAGAPLAEAPSAPAPAADSDPGIAALQERIRALHREES